MMPDMQANLNRLATMARTVAGNQAVSLDDMVFDQGAFDPARAVHRLLLVSGRQCAEMTFTSGELADFAMSLQHRLFMSVMRLAPLAPYGKAGGGSAEIGG